ncbi:MAG TPA: hypothetical protein VLJ78_06975 [Microvirga sp.]|jgi:hypothetical protein|nr:hypothetical protein [Microvirga sp.]
MSAITFNTAPSIVARLGEAVPMLAEAAMRQTRLLLGRCRKSLSA